MRRWFVEGEWVGEYTYGSHGYLEAVPFRMNLRLGWFGFVRGTVQDLSEKGTPDEGIIRGRIRAKGAIAFVKLLPFLYVFRIDPKTGQPMDGRPRFAEGRHPPIHYSGQWNSPKGELSGTWKINGHVLQTGTWTARPTDQIA